MKTSSSNNWLSSWRKLLVLVAGIAFVQTAAATCVTGSVSAKVAPGQSVNDQAHILYMNFPADGWYHFLVSSSGTSLAQNFQIAINGTAVSPGSNFQYYNATPPSLYISYYLLSSAPLCTSQTFTIDFYNVLNQFLCSWTYTVDCMDDTRNNLLVLASGTYYVGDNARIHTQYWNGSGWTYAGITPVGGWGSVEVAGWLAGDYNTDQIFFKGKDNKLYNLYKSSGSWYLGALSSTLTNVKSDIQLRSDGVYYIGTDNYIHRMYWSSGWQYEAITPQNGWQGVTATGCLALSISGSNIFFRSNGNRIVNLTGSPGNWNLYQLYTSPSYNDIAGDLLCDDATGLYYRGADQYVHKLYWNSGWVYDAMSTVNTNATISGALTKFPGENRVFFKSHDNRGYNIYKNGSGQWENNCLSTSMTSVAGDMHAADTKVYFIGTDAKTYNYYYSSSWLWGTLTGTANVKYCSKLYRLNGHDDDAAATEMAPDVMSVFPNPANGLFNVQFSSEQPRTVLVYDLSGREIYRSQSTGQHLQIDLSNEGKGLFILKVEENGQETIRKIVVQ